MDSFVDERDFKVLEDDKYTFFVLRRIIGGKCELIMTDHFSVVQILIALHKRCKI